VVVFACHSASLLVRFFFSLAGFTSNTAVQTLTFLQASDGYLNSCKQKKNIFFFKKQPKQNDEQHNEERQETRREQNGNKRVNNTTTTTTKQRCNIGRGNAWVSVNWSYVIIKFQKLQIHYSNNPTAH